MTRFVYGRGPLRRRNRFLPRTKVAALSASASQAFTFSQSASATLADVPAASASQAFSFAQSATVIGGAQRSSGKGGFDAHYYKRRNKRRTKTEDIAEFVETIAAAPLDEAPAPIIEQAQDAQRAAEAFLAVQTADLRAQALREIAEFYRLIRAEVKRQREEDDDEETLLLLAA